MSNRSRARTTSTIRNYVARSPLLRKGGVHVKAGSGVRFAARAELEDELSEWLYEDEIGDHEMREQRVDQLTRATDALVDSSSSSIESDSASLATSGTGACPRSKSISVLYSVHSGDVLSSIHSPASHVGACP